MSDMRWGTSRFTERSGRKRLAVGTASVLIIGLASAGIVGLSALPSAATTPSGPSWSSVLTPLPANANTVADAEVDVTACPSPGNCVGAGEYRDNSGDDQGLLEVQADGTWTATEALLPANATTSSFGPVFNEVSCTAVGTCMAVGDYRDTADLPTAFVETLSGGHWSATEVPLPSNTGTDGDGNANSELYGVACSAPGVCEAVGYYWDTSGYQYALIETLSGGSWTGLASPLPPNSGTDGDGYADSGFVAVACPSPGPCAAVGSYRDTAGREYALIAQGSAGSWSSMEASEPPNAGTGGAEYAYFNGLSCPASGECVAVGGYNDSGGFGYPLVETLVDATWTATSPPLPSDAGTDADLQAAALAAVSCPVAGACVAVGYYKDTSMYRYGLIETLSNGTWSAATPQQPSNAGTDAGSSQYANLFDVSCSWPGQCVAVGSYQDTFNHDHGMISSLSGGSWSTMESPYPEPINANPEVDLNAVSCVAAMCFIGGDFVDTSGNQQGLIDTYEGSGGYDMAASDGGIFAYHSPFFGSMGGKPLNKPVVGLTIDPATDGYYEVASDGGMFAFRAPFFGSMGGKPLIAPIVAMAFDSLTGGYYEVASDGGIFAFDAPFYGSMGGKPLNKPIVGIAFDPLTGGYYEVASDGGLFAFNAPFFGSMGGKPLNEPVVGMTVNSSTGGYYEVASDGGLFAFDAPFYGSTGNITLNKPVVGMAFDPYTNGYYEVATDGGIFAYHVPFYGSTGNITLNEPVVGMGTT
jgi:hypothetical protein